VDRAACLRSVQRRRTG